MQCWLCVNGWMGKVTFLITPAKVGVYCWIFIRFPPARQRLRIFRTRIRKLALVPVYQMRALTQADPVASLHIEQLLHFDLAVFKQADAPALMAGLSESRTGNEGNFRPGWFAFGLDDFESGLFLISFFSAASAAGVAAFLAEGD